MIDDELKIPKASDETILNKFNERHQYNEYYTKSRTRAPVFSISHYAASVTYTVDNWLAKSKDDISLDTLNCLSLSSVPILRTTMTELLNIRKGPQRSLGVKFKDQLSQLSERLEKSNPFFIRCIKSNEGLSANYFESTFVLNQLKYLGLLSLVQIRKVGYSVRLTYSQFLQRYNLLLIGDSDEAKLTAAGLEQLSPDKQVQLCKQILHRVDQREKDWKLGSSKAFYRSNIQTILEEMRSNELEQQTMYLQAYIKTSLIQHKYQKMINLVNQIEHFLQIYQEKLKTRQLNDITPSKLLPQINPLLLQCQTHNIEPDLQSHKRSVIMATQLTLLKLRLDEQDDAEAFLERALLSNQKDSIQAAIRETQLAFLTPFDGERLEEMIVENNDINFDLFNPTIATLLTNATQLYIALDGYDQLRVKTQNERTLELALSLIKNAQRLGLDKGVVLEAQELYKVIADEVAEKERVRKEALEKERLRKEAEEKEQKRIEDEKKKKKIEEENAKKAEEEKEEEENAKKAQEKAQKDDKSQDFFQNAEKSDSIVVIAPILISPLRPSSSLSSSSSSSETVNRPDYNKINHFIETSNEPQLRSYLSQFERVIVNNNISRSDHLIDVPLSPHSAYKQGLLNLNSTFLPKIPLYEATLRADMNIINTLIEFGADINITNTTGLTPLSTAIKNGRFGLAETFILEHHAAVSQYDVNEETGNSIGHIMAQALSSLLSKFSTSKSKSFFSLLELVLDINDTVIYCVENNSKHTAIQYFKKILKMGSQQLESQIKALSDKKKNTNSLSQHGVNQSNKDQDKEILKANEALQFLTNVKNVLFDTTTDGVSTPRA
jgi:myosin heavy subunit